MASITGDVESFLKGFRRGRTTLLSKADLGKLLDARAAGGSMAWVKFFDPTSQWTWYAAEATIERDDRGRVVDILFFGKVVGLETELGYFSLNELAEAVRGPSIRRTGPNQLQIRLPIERDIHWQPRPLSACTGRE